MDGGGLSGGFSTRGVMVHDSVCFCSEENLLFEKHSTVTMVHGS